jgi:hypothetical protein
MVEFSAFRDSFAALPSGPLSLDDVRTPQFCVYEDRRVVAFYAPFDYLNRHATVALVGVTPGPTQMLEAFEVVRDAVRAGRSDEDALASVKAHASFKGMRRDLARWLDQIGLAAVLGLPSCSELFGDFYRSLLHTTSAVRYPVFVRGRDGSLRNYSGSSPELVAHPWLRGMIETTLASELSALRSAVVIPLGGANRAVTHLQDLGAVDPARCLRGLPHPSPASPFRERYFQAARTDLMSQVQGLDLDAAPPPHRGRPLPWDRREGSVVMPKVGSVPEGGIERIVIRLTQGNLNNNHIYLRKHLDFFPPDAIGAANAHEGEGTLLTLHFEGLLEPVETDIAGDKKIFRCRGEVGRFFAHYGLSEGDHVVIERLSAHEYRIRPAH